MASLTRGYYHCVECGALFEAKVVPPEDQRCSVCGHPPTGKVLVGPQVSPPEVSSSGKVQPRHSGVSHDAKGMYEATLDAQSKKSRGRVKRTKRREKHSRKLIVMLLVWAGLMALTVGLVKYFNPGEETDDNSEEAINARQQRQEEMEKIASRELVQKALPECRKTLTRYLNAPSAASKAQFVYQGAKLSSEMSRYYRRNPSFSSTRSQVQILGAVQLRGVKKTVVATICQNQQGEKFEAVFARVGGEWKLDWKAAVRYNTRSWSLFPSGRDGDEGEFRLYMRVRDSNKKLNTGEINLVFYKPDIYYEGTFQGVPSPTVSVPAEGDLGQEIVKLVRREADMQRDAYGAEVGVFDPPGYHRVRVRMRLHKEGNEQKLELMEILAHHWYDDGVVAPQD